jgi:hypothetical protein
LNHGQAENGFFVVQMTGDKLRAAYRCKHWLEEKVADGKTKRTWDGAWEWQHLLDKTLRAAATPPRPGRSGPAAAN